MTECVLCDWKPDPLAKPLAAYLPGSPFPLWWPPDGLEPTTVHVSLMVKDTWPEVALVHHWAVDHPNQLRGLIERWEIDHWPQRTG